MKKLFVVFAVVFLAVLVVLEIATSTGLTIAKLGFIRHEKVRLEGENQLVIEFPEKITVELAVGGEEIIGLDSEGKEVFRMNPEKFRVKAQLAFAQVATWIEKEPALSVTSEGERKLFRVANARGQEGFAVLRDRRLAWVNSAGKILQQFDLTVIKSKGAPLIFMWKPVEGGE